MAKKLLRYADGRKIPSKTDYDQNVIFQLNLLKESMKDGRKSKKEIRKMLHPTLGDDYLPSDDLKTSLNIFDINKSHTARTKRLYCSNKFYNRKKEFDKMPESKFDIPIIRNSSPYINPEEVYRKEQTVRLQI